MSGGTIPGVCVEVKMSVSRGGTAVLPMLYGLQSDVCVVVGVRGRRRPLIAMLSTVGMCGVFFLFLFGLGSVFKKPNSVRNEFCLVRFKNRGFVRIL